MTWLTAGNSHLIGFALLILFVGLVSGWVSLGYAEEERAERRKQRAAARPRRGKAKAQRVEPRLA